MGVTLPAVIAASRINLRQHKPTQATPEPGIKTTMPHTIPYFDSNWLRKYLPLLASHMNEPLLQAIYKQLEPISMPADKLVTAKNDLNQARDVLNRNRQKLLSYQGVQSKEKMQLLSEIKKNSNEVVIKYEALKKLHRAIGSKAECEVNKAYYALLQSLTQYQKDAQAIYAEKSDLINQASFSGMIILLLAPISICISAIAYPLAVIGLLSALSLLVGALIIKPLYLANKLHKQHPNNEATLNDCFKHFMQTFAQSRVETPDSDQIEDLHLQTIKAGCSHTAPTDNLSCHALLFQPVHSKEACVTKECIELTPQQRL